ncbi:MAG TPA: iron-containing alcohol dehydrogenase [Thermotogota bacterium]|nr:iron-containing alcohol dehydrogenase [Thermotogota bacterium]
MQNFVFYNKTKIIFGRGTENQIEKEINALGKKKVLIHYGGGSIKKTGLYEKVAGVLKDAGLEYIELGGVKPNPSLSLVREGIELCRREKVDFILAVGGGSVIDSSKAIAAGIPYNGDVWDFYDRKAVIREALPIGVILTLPAAGSETSTATVITNDEKQLKRGTGSMFLRPEFAIMNPELTFTLPPYQTAAGITDMLAHIMERYFTRERHVDLTDHLCEAVMKTIVKNAPLVIEWPENYDARAEIMWAGTLAHNGLLGTGRIEDWGTHMIEHELSAIYDLTHGAGLAIIFPAWISYVSEAYPEKIMKFFHTVFDVEATFDDSQYMIEEGIKRLKAFYRSIGMPVSLKEAGITEKRYEEMAEKCTVFGPVGNFMKLDKTDVIKIYELAE